MYVSHVRHAYNFAKCSLRDGAGLAFKGQCHAPAQCSAYRLLRGEVACMAASLSSRDTGFQIHELYTHYFFNGQVREELDYGVGVTVCIQMQTGYMSSR